MLGPGNGCFKLWSFVSWGWGNSITRLRIIRRNLSCAHSVQIKHTWIWCHKLVWGEDLWGKRGSLQLADWVYPEAQTRCSFCADRSTVNIIFSIHQQQDKSREQGVFLYLSIVDLSKTFNTVSRAGLDNVEEIVHQSHSVSPSFMTTCSALYSLTAPLLTISE